MSLKLVFRPSRAKKNKAKRGTYYVEGTDHRGERIHESLKTGDRGLAQREFAKLVAATLKVRVEGARGVVNFADAVELYGKRKGVNTNEPFIDAMLPLVGEKRLCDLTQTDLDTLAKDLCPGCTPATIKRHVYTPFVAVYNVAVDEDPPLADPRKWKAPKIKKTTVDAPDDAYIAKLLEAAYWQEKSGKYKTKRGSCLPERDAAAVLFLTLTGCRSGEAQRVELRDLYLDRGYAMLRKTKGKDANPRQVALAPVLIEALRKQVARLHKQAGVAAPGDTLLFECATRWGFTQVITRTRKRANLPHYRPHQIGRHAFATRLLHSGASLLDVQTAGGWDSAAMVADYYGHLAQEHVDKVVAGIDTTALQKPTPKSTPILDETSQAPDKSGQKRSA